MKKVLRQLSEVELSKIRTSLHDRKARWVQSADEDEIVQEYDNLLDLLYKSKIWVEENDAVDKTY
jgi:hypothetical protein